ncbi:hypothetical protein [Sorangium sp. So ce693]|uniref:hypothetical protein n=1 Tax=Sorangium sp. So ce693 TaxID=3133318 RepID=UPI003F605A93
MNHRRGVLLVVFACGCSIVDPSDRDELRHQIAAMPLEEVSRLRLLGMNSAAINWLEGRPPGDQMGKIQCRYQAGGQWTNWPTKNHRLLSTICATVSSSDLSW